MTARGLAALFALALCGLGCESAGTGRVVSLAGQDVPQVMITLHPAPPALVEQRTLELVQAYRLRLVYTWALSSLGEQCIVFEVPLGRSAEELARRLASDPLVGSAQPLLTFKVLGDAPQPANGPYARLQHSAQALHLEQAHRWATGKGVRIAIVDTGVELDHPDLRGRVVRAHNFVDRGEQSFTSDVHGTAVAGVVAATGNNELGIVGVAPGAELFALKACWQQPPAAREAVCNSYTLAKAIDFAIAQGAQVLNFSLGGPPDPLLARLIAAAIGRGIVVVAADGGEGASTFPASLKGVIGIAGSDDLRGGLRAPTGRPPASTLAAPAVDILTTVPRGSYDFFSGSSLAAAQVSGIAALLLERGPKLTPAQIDELFQRTSRPIPPAPGAPPPRARQVDACAALASVIGAGSCS
jgi:subtilisin family serine protease